MNRTERRRAARAAGISWRQAQIDRMLAEGHEKMIAGALQMSPEEARERLARWAAVPGRTQAEVDAMNEGGRHAGQTAD